MSRRIGGMPLNELREKIAEALAVVKAYNLPDVATRFGLTSGTEQEAYKSKRSYVLTRLQGWSEGRLLELAGQVVREYGSRELEDAVSERTIHSDHRVTPLTRREILRALNEFEPLFGDQGFDSIFENLSLLVPELALPSIDFLPPEFGLKAEIQQHYLRNPDWSNADLLQRCGALSCSQARFFALLEALLHPLARRGENQAKGVAALNDLLRPDGFCAVISGQESGHSIYRVARLSGGVGGSPKNIIFASVGPKPDLVLSDAINNDIRIVRHADKCLVYDRPLLSTGLKWIDLATWWRDTNGHVDLGSARRLLGNRLLAAVRAAHSVPEWAIFKIYYEKFRPALGDDLPALMPQVYLHFDPRTLRERGGAAVLPRQRMDFLMLLDQNVRVVLEIDGKQHYSEGDVASPRLYAEMAREDRDLRLLGYEVYRFGAHEFADSQVEGDALVVGPKSRAAIIGFFEGLFRRHKVPARGAAGA